MTTRLTPRLFNVDEYYLMAKAGILTEDDRVELIAGVIIDKYAVGAAYAGRHLFNIDEYYAMADAGILAEDDRVEMIAGEIVSMTPIGPLHASSVDSLAHFLREQLGRRALVRVQNPLRLDGRSEPQPDITVLRWRDDFYASAHPGPDDVMLLIEVLDSTVETDRDVKLQLYASAGIPAVWLVNLPQEWVEVYTEPCLGVYGRSWTITSDSILRLPGLDDVLIPVSDILPRQD